jgi:hypothetical protein
MLQYLYSASQVCGAVCRLQVMALVLDLSRSAATDQWQPFGRASEHETHGGGGMGDVCCK